MIEEDKNEEVKGDGVTMINTGGPADGFNPRMGNIGVDNFMN